MPLVMNDILFLGGDLVLKAAVTFAGICFLGLELWLVSVVV
jgi:hypothetical protein